MLKKYKKSKITQLTNTKST